MEHWINQGLTWTVEHFRPAFQAVRAPVDATLAGVQSVLTGLPTLGMVAVVGLLAWQFAGRALALGAVVSLLLVAMLGIWQEAMVTLSLVLTSLAFCLVLGLPWASCWPAATGHSACCARRSMPCRPLRPSCTSCRW